MVIFLLDVQKQEGARGTVMPPLGGGVVKGTEGCGDLMINFQLTQDFLLLSTMN